MQINDHGASENWKLLAVGSSLDDQYICMFVGLKTITEEELVKQMIVLKAESKTEFKLFKTIDVDTVGLADISKRFFFSKRDPEQLMLVSKSNLYTCNFVTSNLKMTYDFSSPLYA